MNELILRYLYNLTAGRVWLESSVIFSSVYLGWSMAVLVLIIFLRRQREHPEAPTESYERARGSS